MAIRDFVAVCDEIQHSIATKYQIATNCEEQRDFGSSRRERLTAPSPRDHNFVTPGADTDVRVDDGEVGRALGPERAAAAVRPD
ncbi:MAG: hypothetical protein ACRD0H_13680, partial [Actinomycetes bacterium]